MTYDWGIGLIRHTEDVTYSLGSWEPNYPLSRLKTLPLRNVARSVSASPVDTKLRGVFPERRTLSGLRFCNHNGTVGDSFFTVRLYENASDASPVWTSERTPFWPVVYEESDPQASWDSGNWWDRTYTASELANRNLYIPDSYSVEAFEIDIEDENNADGFFQFGLLELCELLLLPYPPETGARRGLIARSRVTEAEGGGEYFERRAAPRTFTGVVPAVERDISWTQFHELLARMDITEPFLWWPEIGNERHELRASFLGRFQSLDDIAMALPELDEIPLSIKELL